MNKSDDNIRSVATEVIKKEASAVSNLLNYIDTQFIKTVDLIFKSKGRVVITGVGKSAIIANKIVATFNSTGTPALFMHAADAIHGDLGMIRHEDIVMCISKSGETPEIKVLVPLLKRMGNPVIAMVSNDKSYLAKHSDYLIRTTVESEACPNNLAPTSSTTTQLVMGDTIAVVLLNKRGFTQCDFAKLHPGGSLGKRLYTRVIDLIDKDIRPQVAAEETIQNTIINISANRLGATVVTDETGFPAGIITDGDVRRMLERGFSLDALRAKDIMSLNPKTIDSEESAVKAFNIMEENKITSVIVLKNNIYIGLVHIHDIIREGIV
jgi:KpsF/GutQ family protein